MVNPQELPGFLFFGQAPFLGMVRWSEWPSPTGELEAAPVFFLERSETQTHASPAECVAAFVMFATATGILMALFFNNAGGAWDNAKKYIETGIPLPLPYTCKF